MSSLKKSTWASSVPEAGRLVSGNPPSRDRSFLTSFDRLRSATTQLTPIIARTKSLTLRYFAGHLPWWFPSYHGLVVPPSRALERIRVITPGPFSDMMESCRVLDATFSDTKRYPSLKDFEVCSSAVARIGEEGWDTYERLCMDPYLPRLKAMGRLPA